jgi:hypothetical protein
MGDNILVAIVVAVAGSGSLAFLVGKIFGRVIDKTFRLLGNHMTEVKGSVSDLKDTIREHDRNEGERHERWLETENTRVQTCNDTIREILGHKDK